jgi:hypothetical protein
MAKSPEEAIKSLQDMYGSKKFSKNMTAKLTTGLYNNKTFNESMMQGSEMEKELLALIGEKGMAELKSIFENGFQLDETTKSELDRLKTSRQDSAKSTLDYSLDRAAGSASAGAASRGLPTGSLRAELQTRMSAPAVQQFQQNMFAIDQADSESRLNMPRQDFQLRQQALNSPSLSALQRTRLANAELAFRLRGVKNQEKAYKDQQGGIFGGALGTIAGAALNYYTGGVSGMIQHVGGSVMGANQDASNIGSGAEPLFSSFA